MDAQGRLLRTEHRPPIVEGGSRVLPGGDASTFHRRFIWESNSSQFIGKPIPRVNDSKEYLEKRYNEITSYQRHSGHSLSVETADGYGLVVFMQRGMYHHVPRGMENQRRERSESAFRNLVEVYPPVSDHNKRQHLQARKERKSFTKYGFPWGCMPFMYWKVSGLNTDLSATSRGQNSKELEAVKEFMEEVSWENEPIGELMALCDRKSKDKYQQFTQKARDDGQLKQLDQGPHAVNSSLIAIFNMTVQPNREIKDGRDGWASTNSWGDYEGAWLVFPDLGIMIKQEPGDLLLYRSQYLEHWVTSIKGERFCCARMTRDSVIHPLEQWVECPVPGCVWSAAALPSLQDHIKLKHSLLIDTEVKSIMNNIRINFLQYDDRHVGSIAFYFKVRMLEKRKRQRKQKAKIARNPSVQPTHQAKAEDGLSRDNDRQIDEVGYEASGEDEEDKPGIEANCTG